ncbi:MAG TPA: MBL fold metallo-hydrolase [Stellaceae bacterium]|nr:MBL fold metallo-hydrolase [Stellaceae bacterium]
MTGFLIVTLTGTGPGPAAFNGLAGPGTLVRYRDDSKSCDFKLQFDVGRGTTMRLSQLHIDPRELDAVFFTHMHSDHTEGFADLLFLRWMFNGDGPKLDTICAADAVSGAGVTLSGSRFAAHVADSFIHSGEVAQRHSETASRTAVGPADLLNTITFEPPGEPRTVWSRGDVRVSAIRTAHIAGHVSYRVDTPAGAVVIGGDAGNDIVAPPRPSSTSQQVERLARGADVIVHSAIHPILRPDQGSGFYPHAYYRQSTAADLAAMAQRAGAKYLMLTHLIPALGADRHGPFKIPGGPLAETDYQACVREGGFTGHVLVGTDLAQIRLPPSD